MVAVVFRFLLTYSQEGARVFLAGLDPAARVLRLEVVTVNVQSKIIVLWDQYWHLANTQLCFTHEKACPKHRTLQSTLIVTTVLQNVEGIRNPHGAKRQNLNAISPYGNENDRE